MKQSFILALFTVSVLSAQSDTWILDKDNPVSNSQIKWTAPFWGYTYNVSPGDVRIRSIRSPYYEITTNLSEIALKGESDFLESEGWVLLYAFLGGSGVTINPSDTTINPFVILYNKERGILRYFYMKYFSSNHTSAFAELTSNSNTGILSSIHTDQNYVFALDKIDKNMMKQTTITNYQFQYGETWMYSDFTVAYDDAQQHINNSLRFRSRATDIQYFNLSAVGQINSTHSTVNKHGIASLFSFGNYINEYFSKGQSLKNFIQNMPAKLADRGILLPFHNAMSEAISKMNKLGITEIIPYVNVASGVINFFMGNSAGVSSINLSLQAEISGTATLETQISDVTVRQPGRASGSSVGQQPVYNQPLGVVQVRNSPTIDRRQIGSNTNRTYSYKLTNLPSNFIVNPQSGLNPIPIDLKVAFDFKLTCYRLVNAPFYLPFEDNFSDEMNRFLTNYYVNTIPTYNSYHCYSEYIDYDKAKNMVLTTKTRATLDDINIKIMAVFEYANNPAKAPYIYVANYNPTTNSYVSAEAPFEMLPAQNIEKIYKDSTISGNITLNRTYIVDNGATLTLNKVNFSSVSNSDENQYYGILVRNGTLIVNNSTLNLGHGTLRAVGKNSKIVVNDPNNAPNIMNGGTINLVNGAKFEINNAKFNLTNGGIAIDGIGSEVIVNSTNSNKSVLTFTSGSLKLSNNALLSVNNSILQIDEKSVVLLNNSTLRYTGNSNISNLNLSKLILDKGFVEVTGGAKLYLVDANYSLQANNGLKASGVGSEIILNSNRDMTLNGANVDIFSGAIFKISGAKLNLTNNGSINVNNGSLKVESNGSIDTASSSQISLSNSALYTLSNSKLKMNNSTLILNGGSLFELSQNSSLTTLGSTKIKGTVPHEEAEEYDENITIPSARSMLAHLYNVSDRIYVIDSYLDLSPDTEITHQNATSTSKWSGIYFSNCRKESQIRAKNIKGIQTMSFQNSKAYLYNTSLTNIGILSIRDNSNIGLSKVRYFSNKNGIFVDNSSLYVNEGSKIYENGKYGIKVNNPSNSLYIYDSEIYKNKGNGVELLGEYMVMERSHIYQNDKHGFYSVSNKKSFIRDASSIKNNGLAEVVALESCFPSFNHNNKSTVADDGYSNPSNDDKYLLKAIQNSSLSNQALRVIANLETAELSHDYQLNTPISLAGLIIDKSNPERFYPNIEKFYFPNDLIIIKPPIEIVLEAVLDKEYEVAQNYITQIIEESPTAIEAEVALSFLLVVTKEAGLELDAVMDYVDNIEDESLRLKLLETRARVNVLRANYSDAVADYETIINDPDVEEIARLLVELEQAYIYMLLAESNSRSILPKSTRSPKDYQEYAEIQKEILANLLQLNSNSEENNEEMIYDVLQFSATNYPNPFNPETRISLTLPNDSNVRLEVFNVKGQKVKTLLNQNMNKGNHNVIWNGSDDNGSKVSSGIYFYRVNAGELSATKKMILIK